MHLHDTATLRVGRFTLVRWPEIKRWLTMNDTSNPLPELLDRLGAADIFALSEGPERGTFFAVTTDEQRQILLFMAVDSARIFRRSEIEAAMTWSGVAAETLAALSLLDLLKLSAQPRSPVSPHEQQEALNRNLRRAADILNPKDDLTMFIRTVRDLADAPKDVVAQAFREMIIDGRFQKLSPTVRAEVRTMLTGEGRLDTLLPDWAHIAQSRLLAPDQFDALVAEYCVEPRAEGDA